MAHRVYVGNLPFTCSPEDLKQLFAAHAPTGSSIVIDRDTGRSRGFGFVRCREADPQARGASGHGGRADGRNVETELRQLLRGAQSVVFAADDDRMNRGPRSGIEECSQLAQLRSAFVAFGSGAKIQRGRCGRSGRSR